MTKLTQQRKGPFWNNVSTTVNCRVSALESPQSLISSQISSTINLMIKTVPTHKLSIESSPDLTASRFTSQETEGENPPRFLWRCFHSLLPRSLAGSISALRSGNRSRVLKPQAEEARFKPQQTQSSRISDLKHYPRVWGGGGAGNTHTYGNVTWKRNFQRDAA